MLSRARAEPRGPRPTNTCLAPEAFFQTPSDVFHVLWPLFGTKKTLAFAFGLYPIVKKRSLKCVVKANTWSMPFVATQGLAISDNMMFFSKANSRSLPLFPFHIENKFIGPMPKLSFHPKSPHLPT